MVEVEEEQGLDELEYLNVGDNTWYDEKYGISTGNKGSDLHVFHDMADKERGRC